MRRGRPFGVLVAGASIAAALLAAPSPPSSAASTGTITTRIVLGSDRPMTATQRHTAIDELRSRAAALGFAGATVTAAPRELVVRVGARLTALELTELTETGQLQLRPADCWVPARSTSGRPVAIASSGSCAPRNELSRANLDDHPADNPRGYSVRSVAPDRLLAGAPTTAPRDVRPSSQVLLAASRGSGDPTARALLGPAAMDQADLYTTGIATEAGRWFVALATVPGEAGRLDALLLGSFHQFVAVVFDDVVVSAPLVEPSQNTWSSPAGQIIIEVGSQPVADTMAFAIRVGSLPVVTRVLEVHAS